MLAVAGEEGVSSNEGTYPLSLAVFGFGDRENATKVQNEEERTESAGIKDKSEGTEKSAPDYASVDADSNANWG